MMRMLFSHYFLPVDNVDALLECGRSGILAILYLPSLQVVDGCVSILICHNALDGIRIIDDGQRTVYLCKDVVLGFSTRDTDFIFAHRT